MSTDKPLSIEVLGTVFTVWWGTGVTPEQRELMRRAWSRCIVKSVALTVPSPKDEPAEPTRSLPFTALVTFTSNSAGSGRRNLAAVSYERLAERMTSELTYAAILEQAGKLTMLHACGVADLHTGAVIALVAKSGTGKTTAATVLARKFGYVTDETVAVAPQGDVVAYPKPLSVKQVRTESAKAQIGPDDMGLKEAPEALSLGAIVLLDRSNHHAGKPTLHRVPLADAVLALIPESSSQAQIENPLQSLCRLIEAVGGVWRVRYAEAEDLATAFGALSFPPSEKSSAWFSCERVGDSDADNEEFPTNCYLRNEPLDAVEIDGELILMLASEVVRLTGVGPAIWRLSSRPVTMQEIVRELENSYGLPDDYQTYIDAAVGSMVARGLLRTGTTR